MNTDDDGGSARPQPVPSLTSSGVGYTNWKIYLLILGIFSLILVGCREETDLYFYTNRSWKVESSLTVDEALIDLVMGAGGMAIGSELGIPIPGSILESENWISLSYDWIVNAYRTQGLEADWHQQSNTYILSVKGENYASLPGVQEGLIILEPVADGQFHLRMETLALGGEMGDLGELQEISSQLSMFGYGYEREVTLHAGRIISSNATEVRGGRAIWRNPDIVDVTFVPASPFPAPLAISLTCLISLVGTISLAVKGKFGGSKCPTCGGRVHRRQEICPNCGGYVGNDI